MIDDIPDWAIEQAAKLTSGNSDVKYDARCIRALDTGMAFAREFLEKLK